MDPIASHDDASIPFRAVQNHTHSTWARTFHSRPELYIQPQSIPEIEKVVRLARKCRRRISMIGCGHSPSDLTCTSSWAVNLDNFNRVLEVNRAECLVVMQSGIRLWQLGEELEKHGLGMPSMGSIDEQSIAGAIATGTHGSSMEHGLLSDSIVSMKITLASGKTETCSQDRNPDLFRAALLSLGGLGIIAEVTFRAVPAFKLAWTQVVDTDMAMLDLWSTTLWTQAEFVRAMWFPYTRRATVWSASRTDLSIRDPPTSSYGGAFGYHVYHNLLYLASIVPRILPWIEWFIFGMQLGFANGTNGKTTSAVQPSRKAFLLNCLYSQVVNEWAIPLSKGPEALLRLSSWLNRLDATQPGYVDSKIPFDNKGIFINAPIEVRVVNTTKRAVGNRPFLDCTFEKEPTLYLNATLYRPHDVEPAFRDRYYQAFEWLMLDLGGRPHWAKNFLINGSQFETMYGKGLEQWRRVRSKADPEGMFIGEWHRRNVLGNEDKLALEEVEVGRKTVREGGLMVQGAVSVEQQADQCTV